MDEKSCAKLKKKSINNKINTDQSIDRGGAQIFANLANANAQRSLEQQCSLLYMHMYLGSPPKTILPFQFAFCFLSLWPHELTSFNNFPFKFIS